MNDVIYSPTPDAPGLYVDAAGEVWRVHFSDDPAPQPTFDELLEQAILQPAEQAARSGPFVPLLALTVEKQDLLLEALAALRGDLTEGWDGRFDDQVAKIAALADEIEALG